MIKKDTSKGSIGYMFTLHDCTVQVINYVFILKIMTVILGELFREGQTQATL